MTEMLFGGFPDPERPLGSYPPPVDEREARHLARRKTIDNRRARWAEAIAKGTHPLNGRPLLDTLEEHTCGGCVHRFLKVLARPYPKCDLGPITGGPATDVLASWPACERWETKRS